MSSNTTTLNRKKGNIKAQITKLSNWKETNDPSDIAAHLTVLEKLQKKFDDSKTEYFESTTDEEILEIEISLAEMDSDIQDLEVRFTTLLHNCKIKNSNSNDTIHKCNNTENIEASANVAIKLPKIPLPVFSGKIDEWNLFKSQFQSLIEDNKNLSENQKLYYLRAALKGEAKDIETSDDTFQSLFKALDERYENKRLIIDNHVKNIINYDKLTQESAKDLRTFLDCITKNLRALKILNYEKDKLSNILLLNIILQKLALETRKQYELSLITTEVPDFDDLIEFLEKRYLVLNNISRNLSVRSKYFEKGNNTKALFVKSPSLNSALCLLCKNVHALYKCESFLNLTPEKSYAFIRNNNLCLNCFGLHKVAYCRSKFTCITCKSKHHSLLHWTKLALRGQRSQDPSPEGEKQTESSETPSEEGVVTFKRDARSLTVVACVVV
ncbi:uncharacterized protein NPIL_238451 [Nephila pilipes]|uniref:Uncharacterized protein n=1 Tax=Nephila pilipes TaxID=299642 RepID=A0A8X6PVV3_NEPPI|nr:uncharacterized protein NPIL_238451 [Nephila pilipes]